MKIGSFPGGTATSPYTCSGWERAGSALQQIVLVYLTVFYHIWLEIVRVDPEMVVLNQLKWAVQLLEGGANWIAELG